MLVAGVVAVICCSMLLFVVVCCCSFSMLLLMPSFVLFAVRCRPLLRFAECNCLLLVGVAVIGGV